MAAKQTARARTTAKASTIRAGVKKNAPQGKRTAPREATAKAGRAASTRAEKGGSLARHTAVLKALRRHGLAFPEAHTKSPWPGHLDLAVRDKTFAYLSLEGEPLSVSCKLPLSRDEAMSLPFTSPTEYGLGKSGWVTATFATDVEPPLEFLKLWLEESYRAQAPKKLAKLLGQSG